MLLNTHHVRDSYSTGRVRHGPMNDLKNHLFCVLTQDIFNNQINEYMTKLTNELCERAGHSRIEERT